jgi:hypothetical protein
MDASASLLRFGYRHLPDAPEVETRSACALVLCDFFPSPVLTRDLCVFLGFLAPS